MSNDYSTRGLLQFLKEAGMNGQINPATARSRRLAAESLLQDLPARQQNDLRELCLDSLCAKINKRESSQLRPEVVALYRERVQLALDDFLTWQDNPDQFEASTDDGDALRHRRGQRNRSENELAREEIELKKTDLNPDLLPVKIRPDKIVYIQNLPFDLTAAEAEKINAVVKAMSAAQADG